MSLPTSASGSLEPNIFDNRALADIKRLSKDNDPKALKAAAKQFEAMFLQMMLKSMRDATPQDGMLDSDQTRMYQSLLDQQLAQSLAGKSGSGSLATMIEKQLSRGLDAASPLESGLPPAITSALSRIIESPSGKAGIPAAPAGTANPASVAAVTGEAGAVGGGLPTDAREFVNRVWPHAVAAGQSTGIPPAFLIAHSALESGWGKAEPRRGDGSPSFNLFGIKAGRSWSGATVDAATTEYVDGVPQRQTERFRAYGSYAEAFQDYARLLASNPRFTGVLGSRDGDSFARNLQLSGYATDPAYADKLKRILSGTTLRQALAT